MAKVNNPETTQSASNLEFECDMQSQIMDTISALHACKKLGFKKDKSLPNVTNKAVSGIVKQVSGKNIWISLHQLLEIVKPEIGLEIIDLIANPNISRRNHTPSEAKRKCKDRKKLIFNDTASESSSGSESSNDDEDFTVDVVKVKKRG